MAVSQVLPNLCYVGVGVQLLFISFSIVVVWLPLIPFFDCATLSS